MSPLTLDLISTTLAALGVITCGLGAIVILPWGEWNAPATGAPVGRIRPADLVPAGVVSMPAVACGSAASSQ